MSDWSLEDDSQFDFMDPNDPTAAHETTAAPRPDGKSSGPDEGEDADAGAALSDDRGAVHVWLDDERRVVKVRVSNRWRERLKDTPLGDTVAQTIVSGQSRGEAYPDLPEPTEEVSGHAMSEAALDALLERTLELDDKRHKLEALPPDQITPTRWEGRGCEGTSANRMVTVALGIQGITHAVRLDEEWLAGAKAADLGQAILEAHQNAYAQFTPPTLVPGDFAKLAAEGELLRREAEAMLARGQ